jgi:putative Mn2+ efflux pump MntP
MTNPYVAKVRAKKKAQFRSALQSALGVALMMVIGAVAAYLAYVFYGHGCGC